MDISKFSETYIMNSIKRRFSDGCINFHTDRNSEEFLENLSLYDENLLQEYLETGNLSTETISRSISERNIFPVFSVQRLSWTALMNSLIFWKNIPVKKYTAVISAQEFLKYQKMNRETVLRI